MPKLIILRCMPDSNKLKLVNTVFSDCVHFEADMYFVTNDKYLFEPTKLSFAHSWCQRMVEKNLQCGKDVVVTNTFTRAWELEPYLKIASQLNIEADVFVAKGKGENKTQVPQLVMDKMSQRWEDLSRLGERNLY